MLWHIPRGGLKCASMIRQITFALGALLCVTAVAAEPEMTFEVIHYSAPAGWKTADQPGGRVYVSPDADEAAQAAIILFAAPKTDGKFDLRANFDQMVKSTLQGRKQTDSGELTASKTRQGYDALTQTITAEDAKAVKLFVKIVAANVDNRFAGFCYAASNQAAYDKHADEFSALLQSVSFAPAAAIAAPARPPKPAAAGAAAEAWEFDELYAPRVMTKEKKAQYVKEMDQRRKPRVALGTILGADGKPIPNAKL